MTRPAHHADEVSVVFYFPPHIDRSRNKRRRITYPPMENWDGSKEFDIRSVGYETA